MELFCAGVTESEKSQKNCMSYGLNQQWITWVPILAVICTDRILNRNPNQCKGEREDGPIRGFNLSFIITIRYIIPVVIQSRKSVMVIGIMKQYVVQIIENCKLHHH